MLELVSSGLLSTWLDIAGLPAAANTGQSQVWLDVPVVSELNIADASETVLGQYLQRLESQGYQLEQQGIWLQSGIFLLGKHRGTEPLPAASLTKVATSLVALDTWGPDHRFETLIQVTGPIQAGIVQGDLVIQGGGDPFFVWEEAIALGNTLNRLGIQRVTGNLVIVGDFAMNFESDPEVAGALLFQGLNADFWSLEAEAQYEALAPETPRTKVIIDGSVQVADAAQGIPLIQHQSLQLVQILKEMNNYSNNSMAEMLAETLGGGPAIAQRAAQITRVPAAEIQLINGSGLGHGNRLSPRAVCALFQATQRRLQVHGLTLGDVFPLARRDPGTIEDRQIPLGAAVKTGTLWDVSTLAGVLPTRDRGLVWFAILNRGEGLEDFRDQQDQLLRTLQQAWGQPLGLPNAIAPTMPRHQERSFLGATSRNEVLSGG